MAVVAMVKVAFVWIPVSDGLPDKACSVLVYAPSADGRKEIGLVWYEPNHGADRKPAWLGTNELVDFWWGTVTHWIPVPPLPSAPATPSDDRKQAGHIGNPPPGTVKPPPPPAPPNRETREGSVPSPQRDSARYR